MDQGLLKHKKEEVTVNLSLPEAEGGGLRHVSSRKPGETRFWGNFQWVLALEMGAQRGGWGEGKEKKMGPTLHVFSCFPHHTVPSLIVPLFLR